MSHWLVVDDESSICWGLTQLGENGGNRVATASSAEQALQIEMETPDVIVLDVRLPGMDGLTAMHRLREKFGAVPIIVMTAYGDLDTAVRAVKAGAFDYVLKPFELEAIERSISRACALRNNTPTDSASSLVADDQELVGDSLAMQRVYSQIALAASSDASVLIQGESGTGKELVARAIHRYSNRGQGRFVAVNVASLSESVAESELFGHKRGSFTGAEADRKGLLEIANGGTLFLDEVADIPLNIQVKLLRAIEQGEVTPVGGIDPVKTDFRLVSATHQNLLQQIDEGCFRHDLYYRISSFQIETPPLRERPEDIRAIVSRLLEQSGHRYGVADSAWGVMETRHWPGNVRELRNAIEHAMIVVGGGMIESEHLPPPVQLPGIQNDLEHQVKAAVLAWASDSLQSKSAEEDNGDGQIHAQLLALVEPVLFRAALHASGNQVATAARRLGIHRTTLRKKLDDRD